MDVAVGPFVGKGPIRDSISGTTFDNVENNNDLGATFDPGNRLRTYYNNTVAMLYEPPRVSRRLS